MTSQGWEKKKERERERERERETPVEWRVSDHANSLSLWTERERAQEREGVHE